MTKIEREENGNEGRFVLYEDDRFAGEMTFTREDSTKLIIDSTRVQEAYNGKGYGKQLVMKAVEYAREQQIRIVPVCSYAKKVFGTTPEINDVLFSQE